MEIKASQNKKRKLSDRRIALYVLAFLAIFFLSKGDSAPHTFSGIAVVLLLLLWPSARSHSKAVSLFYAVVILSGTVVTYNIIFDVVFWRETLSAHTAEKIKSESESKTAGIMSSPVIPASSQPRIIEMVPANGAQNVPVDLQELIVKFDVEMAPIISLGTPCTAGVCYKNAYWRDSKTLVIKVVPSLLGAHKYEIQLGNGHLLADRKGQPLPSFKWTFSTHL